MPKKTQQKGNPLKHVVPDSNLDYDAVGAVLNSGFQNSPQGLSSVLIVLVLINLDLQCCLAASLVKALNTRSATVDANLFYHKAKSWIYHSCIKLKELFLLHRSH